MVHYKSVVKRCVSRLLNFVVSVHASKIRERIPRPLRTLLHQFLPKRLLERKMWEYEYDRIIKNVKPVPHRTAFTLGITKDFMSMYANYEAACIELGVPYKLINIASDSWINEVKNSNCDAFLVWPSHFHTISKQMFDERLWILVHGLNKVIFPSYLALWLYESKRRTNDWLTVNNIPRPQTSVFFERSQAMEFLETATFPLVFKTDLGAATSGIEILRNIRAARLLVNTCFGKGYLRKNSRWNDREWGCVLFQEYIHDAKEWRMIRIGESFFGHQKLKIGDFHSGHGLVKWCEPPLELLNFCREITEKGSFLSMDIDIFETKDGRYLVNELQALFGTLSSSEMYINGKPGRFIYNVASRSWNFEEGDFCRHNSCNLRVKTLLKLLGEILP